jgi:predicted dehydrogenase
MSISDGANYAPSAAAEHVVAPGEFRFAAAFLDHGHINGQVNGLLDAGGELVAVYDTDPSRLKAFCERFPTARVVEHFADILADDSIQLVAAAAIPNQRADIGVQVLNAGKDYFTDKSPFTTLEQLETVRQTVERTNRRYFVYYAERLHNEAAWRAGEITQSGEIGDVIQVLNIAPHRLSAATRPHWFFDKPSYGGILTDIGSHQVEQFLTYAGCLEASLTMARVRKHPEYTGLEDFGEMAMVGDNGASFYSRVDWFTPHGMPVWGDGRTFILGTKGSIEVRKYVDLARKAPASVILLADQKGVYELDCAGSVGFPFFGQLILDSLHGTDTAMTQAHIFKAAELSMAAQKMADEQHG